VAATLAWRQCRSEIRPPQIGTMTSTETAASSKNSDPVGNLGKWLAGGFAFITTIFGALGIAEGDIERIFRNQPGEALVWLLLVGIGIASGLVVGYTEREKDKELSQWSLMFSTLGAVLVVVAALLPVITTRLEVPDASFWRWSVVVVGSAGFVWSGRLLLRRLRGGPASDLDQTAYWPAMGLMASAGLIWCSLTITSVRAALVVLGGLLLFAGLARAVWPPRFHLRAGVLGVGFIAFFVGLGGFFTLSVENAHAKDRPVITASLVETDGEITLSATIEATGLSIDEHVLVTVEGLSRSEQLSTVKAGRSSAGGVLVPGGDSSQTLHLSRTGPDQTGAVNFEVSVPVSPGLYERIRISAFLASASSEDILGQLERLNRRIAIDSAERDQYDELNDVFRLDPEEEQLRTEYDETHEVVDEEEQKRRDEVNKATYEKNVGEEELGRREEFDATAESEREQLLTRLEEELLQDVRCSASRQARGCVILLLREVPTRPQLTASPVLSDGEWTLNVSVASAVLSADDVVMLAVFSRPEGASGYTEELYQASLPPNKTGSLQTEFEIRLRGTNQGSACVVAELVRGGRGTVFTRYQPSIRCVPGDHRVSAVEVDLARPPIEITTTMPTND
jgi:MFS family permease